MAEAVNGVATEFRSQNYKYSTLRGGINLYQSMCSKFRYGDGKVLSTQSRPTHGLASIHCVPSLNLIKGKVNMYPNSHTHTSMYLKHKKIA